MSTEAWPIVAFVVGTFLSIVTIIFAIRSGYSPIWLRKQLLSLSRRKCRSLFWNTIQPGQLVDGQQCNDCALGLEHREDTSPVFEHDLGSTCWSQVVNGVFSCTEFGEASFPRSLDSPGRYLCVDVKVLLAFVFSVIPDAPREISCNQVPGNVFDGSVVDLAEDGGNLIAHVKGTHRRYLTLEDCDGLVHSFPPWYRRTIKLNYPGANLTLDHPCSRNSTNCARAGWVIAVALTDVAPMPAYLDRSTFVEGQVRGKVLRAGCVRTRIVLERFRALQMRVTNLESAIQEISILLDHGPSMGTHVRMPSVGVMTAGEWRELARIAIQIFDTKPAERLSSEDIQALETRGELIVYWASYGVYKVLEYWKNPGREIVWDERLKPGRKIYLQDCRLPLI